MRDAGRVLAAEVARILDRLEIQFMLVGAGALAVNGLSRATSDVDFMTSNGDVLDYDWEADLGEETVVDSRRGDSEDPLAGVVRLRRAEGAEVDLVVGRWKWQEEMIARSGVMDLGGFTTRVPAVEDLVVLKVEAGSYLDQRDAAQLIMIHGPAVLGRVDAIVKDLPEYVRLGWAKLKSELEAKG